MRQCATITIGDVMKKKIRVCENSMVLVYILAIDVYKRQVYNKKDKYLKI